jgi:hypothetical protein
MNAECKAVNEATQTMSETETVTVKPPIEIVTTEGHALALKNTIFLLGQCLPKEMTPTIVGGFRQWRAQGRTVKKGEVSLKIFAPAMRKTKDGQGDKEKEMYFRLVSVFDISQTVEIGSESEADNNAD